MRVGDTIIGRNIAWLAMRENASCESNVFQFRSDRQCVYSDWNGEGEVGIITNQGYLILWPKPKQIKYTCGRESGNLTISEPTFIRSELECNIKSDEFELESVGAKALIKLHDLFIKIDCCSGFDDESIKLGEVHEDSYNQEQVMDMGVMIEELQRSVEVGHRRHNETLAIFGAPVIIIILCLIGIWYIRQHQAARAVTIVDAGWNRYHSNEQL